MFALQEFRILNNYCIQCRSLSEWTQKLRGIVSIGRKQKIRQIGDPLLREQAKPVERAYLITPEFKEIVDKMVSTLRKRNAAGIAAPQIGYSLQVIALEFTGNALKQCMKKYGSKGVSKMEMSLFPLKVLINPKIEIIDPTVVSFKEGCLSIHRFSGVVPRAKQIKVEALNIDGENINFLAHGWTARIIQHEVDHLRGNLFVDSMLYKSLMNEEWRNHKD